MDKQKEASSLIEAALEKALELIFEDHEIGDMLHEWVIIAHVANVDPEKGDGYPMLFSNGKVPTYAARGLLHTGLRMLNEDD